MYVPLINITTVTGADTRFNVKVISPDKDLEQELDRYILTSILAELRNLKDIVSSKVSPESIRHRRTIIATISELTKLGREIKDIAPGSVVFTIMCPTLESLDDLYELYTSGKLSRMFSDAYVTEDIRQKGVAISVTVDEVEWQHCRTHFHPKGETLLQ